MPAIYKENYKIILCQLSLRETTNYNLIQRGNPNENKVKSDYYVAV